MTILKRPQAHVMACLWISVLAMPALLWGYFAHATCSGLSAILWTAISALFLVFHLPAGPLVFAVGVGLGTLGLHLASCNAWLARHLWLPALLLAALYAGIGYTFAATAPVQPGCAPLHT
jgi:hypothetical protein